MAWWLVQHLVTVTLVAAMVHLVCRLFPVGPVFRHALWAVVLVKLVTPPMLLWPWAVTDAWIGATPGHQASSAAITNAQDAAGGVVTPSTAGSAVDAAAPGGPVASLGTDAIGSRRVNGSDNARRRGLQWIVRPQTWLWLWLGGGIAFALLHLVRGWRMARLVWRGVPAPPALHAQIEHVAARLGIRPVDARLAAVSSPLVWSVGRPVLLWPSTFSDQISTTALRSLVAHELAHVKRRDHWLGWVELAGGCAWWWNPIFWHVRRQTRANAELACDAWATYVTPEARRSYAEALLALCAGPGTPSAPMPVLGVSTGDRRFLERRLAMIMRARVPVRLSRIASCAVVFVALVSLPAWAQRAGTTSAPPAPAPTQATPAPVQKPAAPAAPRTTRPVTAVPILTVASPLLVTAPIDQQLLPAEAKALLDKYSDAYRDAVAQAEREIQERLAQEREDLIRQLQQIQDDETKAGHLDEALAVRNRVRQLQAGSNVSLQIVPNVTYTPGRSVGTTPVSPVIVASDDLAPNGQIVALRGHLWQTLTFTVTGSTVGSVWGSGVYTDDSNLSAAAVHAGVVRPGETRTIAVTILPGQADYAGSTANGVSSMSYGSWSGSYRVEGPTSPSPSTGRVPPAPRAPAVAPAPAVPSAPRSPGAPPAPAAPPTPAGR